MHRGPLIPTIALASGIAISAVFDLSWWWSLIPVTISVTLYFLLLKFSTDPVGAFRIGKWHMVWVILLFFGIGLTDESLSRPVSLERAYGGYMPDSLYCEVTGVLTKTYGERIDAVIKGTGGAKVRIRSGVTDITTGDIIRIPSGRITEVDADTTATGKRLRPMLKAAGILYVCRLVPESMDITGKSHSVRYFFTDIRERIESAVERSSLRKPTADFLKAILMGDKTGLDEQTRLTFANGGMAHMLALSGLHIGILAGFLLMLAWPLKLVGRYKWSYAVAIITLWIYVAVTGMAYSSVRACLMTTFAYIGIIAERKNSAGNALCSACMLILLCDPSALFDAGFQLSAVCVAALLAYASKLNPIGHRHHPVLFHICGALIATMVATAASWVLTSYYFSQIPLMFLPSNLLLLPLLPFYLCIGFIFIAFLCMGAELEWLGYLLDHGYDFLLRSTGWLSGGTEFVVEYQLPLWGVAIWMLLLASGAFAIYMKEMK